MGIINTIKREIGMAPVLRDGYSRKLASIWYRKTNYELNNYDGELTVQQLKEAHKRGFLGSTVERYKLDEASMKSHINDFSYLYLSPFNNSFTKWVLDIMTTNSILVGHEEHLREVYFSLFTRNQEKHILKTSENSKNYEAADVIDVLKEKEVLEIRPSFWLSKQPRYKIEYMDDKYVRVNGYVYNYNNFAKFLDERISDSNYVIADYVDLKFNNEGIDSDVDHYIKFWIANDLSDKPVILSAMIGLYHEDEEEAKRVSVKTMIDVETGEFTFRDETLKVDNWNVVKEKLINVCASLDKLTYYTISIALTGNGSFKIVSASAEHPLLPPVPYNSELDEYLLEKFRKKVARRNYTYGDKWNAIKKSRFEKFVKKHCRPGVRPYMQKLWFEAVWDDFKNTKVSLPKKIWAWKRGFLSFRIEQYGLTEQNYKEFLSDYDYHWLNRINSSYQIWINDKTTFRYILEPFRDCIPEYYHSIWKNSNRITQIDKMMDCPEGIEEGAKGIIQLVQQKGKLALKPSAGTHGDGFYCLAWENDTFTVNGEEYDAERFEALVDTFKSFYLVTEYINMHPRLKEIYDKSVNSIRIIVLNEDGHNPEIVQSYMRIGSSRTGYTDNVGYGGICVMVDQETGELYNPETIADHKFYPCPEHPDTKTPIAGELPNWALVKEKVLAICRYLSELEYLGFDVAITEDGLQIIEINIHPDLHKVPTFNDKLKTFFERKIALKKSMYENK